MQIYKSNSFCEDENILDKLVAYPPSLYGLRYGGVMSKHDTPVCDPKQSDEMQKTASSNDCDTLIDSVAVSYTHLTLPTICSV